MRKFGKILSIITFIIFCFALVPAWAITVSEVKSFVDELPLEDFNSADADLKMALQKELEAISDTLDLAEVETDEEHRTELKQDILKNLNLLKEKNSSCVINGTPGEDASLVDCASQEILHSLLEALISELNQSE